MTHERYGQSKYLRRYTQEDPDFNNDEDLPAPVWSMKFYGNYPPMAFLVQCLNHLGHTKKDISTMLNLKSSLIPALLNMRSRPAEDHFSRFLRFLESFLETLIHSVRPGRGSLEQLETFEFLLALIQQVGYVWDSKGAFNIRDLKEEWGLTHLQPGLMGSRSIRELLDEATSLKDTVNKFLESSRKASEADEE